jgi:hypothetical protein
MPIGSAQLEGSLRFVSESIVDDHINSNAAIARSKLALDALKVFGVKLTDFRVWDAVATNLPGTAANDDLALVNGTFATNSPAIQAGDLKAAGATTRYARVFVQLPAEYVSARQAKLRFTAGMVTTAADTSCTLDVQVYESDGDGGISADLCTTSAQSINNLTAADKDFVLTATDLVAGDWLDVRVAIACNDGGTGTAVIPQFGRVQLLCDVRG